MQPPRDKGLPMQTAESVLDAQRFEDPDIAHLVIEDDEPVDNIFTEKQERLLTTPLYASWEPVGKDGSTRRSFEVFANVGLFHTPREQAIVPDVMLSLDVKTRNDLSVRKNRTYFVWEFGKVPDVVVEIVSNDEGGELDTKMRRYRQMRIPYYVVYDPDHELSPNTLLSYELRGDLYIPLRRHYFEAVGLGVVEWTGVHENLETTWLRWCTKDGQLVPTSEERAKVEEQRANDAAKRAKAADKEKKAADKRAEDADKRAERYAAKLRAAGIDPEAA